jgi:hypothetical protein
MKSLAGYAARYTARYTALILIVSAFAQTQPHTQTAAERLSANFADLNRKLLAMAKDFPADKYNFRLKPEMRSFGEVMAPIASGNVYAAKAGRGEKVKWDELDAKKYPAKAAIVALMEKTIADSTAALKENPEGAVSIRDRALRRALWLAGGLLPGERLGPTGIAPERQVTAP